MRTIGVVTVARSDYGIYLPILCRLQDDPDLRLSLIVSGMHLSPEFGLTVKEIEADGFDITERVEMLLSSDTPEGVAKSMGLGLLGFAQLFGRWRPDILLVLGDRFEMHAAALASLPFKIPVAHIHGGESTEGAIDEALRHSITKMSHLHFVTTDLYRRRVIGMGEEPWRVMVSGAPGLDNLHRLDLLDRNELEKRFGFDFNRPLLLATYHPVTLDYERTPEQMEELFAAIDEVDANVIFTYPNADTRGRQIIQLVEEYGARNGRVWVGANLGTQVYLSLMNHVTAMVGNSSSGIIEAASFKLPVVNIGSRQRGRVRERNVIDVDCRRAEIKDGLERAMSKAFRAGLDDLVNPYGDGHAAPKIISRLKEIKLDEKLILKRFNDVDNDGDWNK
ncbi:MAG: UDP-N-acetylglucosamine 2-epimerase [Actinomycetota bacterium]|nr:UDP-N-acetylglucosamine 2-epimerase [Actinomycetota bacterium]